MYGIDVNVTDVMTPWIEQMGYPVVTVNTSRNGTSIDVTQKMFLINPLRPLREFYPSQFK